MRSPLYTFFLALAAAAVCTFALWQARSGNSHGIFGTPPVVTGAPVYGDLQARDVKTIRLELKENSRGSTLEFSLGPDGWAAEKPWKDRVDPRIALGIIEFTRSMRVEDSARFDDAGKAKDALKARSVSIELEGADGRPLAKYLLGQPAPWKAENKDGGPPVPTVYLRRMDEDRKDSLYVVTGDINPFFKDNFRFLRDHHPFSFHPLALQKITLTSPQGELTLGREAPDKPWRIVKPLDLATSAPAVKSLIERLYELTAAKVSNRAEVTLPPAATNSKSTRISLQSFGSSAETTLEIFPPENAAATDAIAIVSNRPESVLSIPLKPERGLVSIADLPLTLNELRDPALTRLHVPSLRGILIQSATNPDIIISREPPAPWKATVNGRTFDANEENLYRLLKAVTETRASGFESDAATDFTPWGLDKPFLSLRFLAANNDGLELRFGMDGKGGYFANRPGTPTVMRISDLLIRAIAVRPYEWMHARPWSVNRVYLSGIAREISGQPPLTLKYDFNFETWSGSLGGKDINSDLDADRANHFLNSLENLKADRWLAANDPAALSALARPSAKITIFERGYDDQSNFTGIVTHTLQLAPVPDGGGNFYGRVNSSPHPFLLNPETVRRITGDITE